MIPAETADISLAFVGDAVGGGVGEATDRHSLQGDVLPSTKASVVLLKVGNVPRVGEINSVSTKAQAALVAFGVSEKSWPCGFNCGPWKLELPLFPSHNYAVLAF